MSKGTELNLVDIFSLLWKKKNIITSVTVVITAVALVILLNMPNVYESKATVSLVKEDNETGALQGLASQFGGLANLAGINLGGKDGGDEYAIEIVESRRFLLNFIKDHQLEKDLLAAVDWDANANVLAYDDDMLDEKGQWILDDDKGGVRPPNDQELYDEIKDIFSVTVEPDSGVVSLSMRHISPFLAKQWLESIISRLNYIMKNKKLRESQQRINYLNEQIQGTDIAAIQSIFYQLIESEYQTKMLAETRDEYIFKTIDPAYFPDEESAPLRALILIVVCFSAFILASCLCLVREAFSRRLL